MITSIGNYKNSRVTVLITTCMQKTILINSYLCYHPMACNVKRGAQRNAHFSVTPRKIKTGEPAPNFNTL